MGETTKRLRVLGIRNKGAGFALLFQYLEDRGCECETVASYSEGVHRFEAKPFDIVLCSGEPGIEVVLNATQGSLASVFCAHTVEDGCWWFPVVRQGAKCLGEPALRSAEFADFLERLLAQRESAAKAGSS